MLEKRRNWVIRKQKFDRNKKALRFKELFLKLINSFVYVILITTNHENNFKI